MNEENMNKMTLDKFRINMSAIKAKTSPKLEDIPLDMPIGTDKSNGEEQYIDEFFHENLNDFRTKAHKSSDNACCNQSAVVTQTAAIPLDHVPGNKNSDDNTSETTPEMLPVAKLDPTTSFPPLIDKPDLPLLTSSSAEEKTPKLKPSDLSLLSSSEEKTPKLKPMLKNAGRSFSEESHTGITDMMGIDDCRKRSVVDELLFDIYDRWHYGRRLSFDSDTFTECSSTSDAFDGRHGVVHSQLEEQNQGSRLNRIYLSSKEVRELKLLKHELQRHVAVVSARLIRELKRKDRRQAKQTRNCDVITAVLQASSQKRRVDSQIRFTIRPGPGDDTFCQWRDAMRAVARLPQGLPKEFRKKVWLALADKHLESIQIDWEKTKRFAFNERSNPDDNKLGLQIVKDLHRTGCSGFSGQDNEEERALLKRVLLAYARWNKAVGYCQGFNVLAALILDVMERHEDDALKVMIFLIDHVLPASYFANNLRALSVDMAVFRDLLKLQLPQLARHLDQLQAAARDDTTGANYEPPLTNVFTMQWFLTLFATCLPQATALRIWDSVLLEGSEIMLRTALAIWSKLQSRILCVDDADEFYTTMGALTQDMLDTSMLNADSLIKSIYTMAPFPFPQLVELREKYTFNITPFSAAMSTGGQRSKKGVTSIFSDDDEYLEDEEMMESIGCFAGMLAPVRLSPSRAPEHGLKDSDRSPSSFDVSRISPGAYAATPQQLQLASAHAERMNMDLSSLKKQYSKVRARQKQAHIILAAANARHQAKLHRGKPGKAPMATTAVPATVMAPIESPVAVNHLYLGRTLTMVQKTHRKNRTVMEAPKIASLYPDGATQNMNGVSNPRTRGSISNQSDSIGGTERYSGSFQCGSRTVSMQSIDSEVSATASSHDRSMLSASTSDVSTVCGSECDVISNCDDVFSHARFNESCDQEVNEETGEIVMKDSPSPSSEHTCDISVTDSDGVTTVQETISSPILTPTKSEHATQSTHCDMSKLDAMPHSDDLEKIMPALESRDHISEEDEVKAKRPNTLDIIRNEKNAQQERTMTHHHVYPSRSSSVSDNEDMSPNRHSPSPSKSASKVYNPFPSQHINRRRAQNGVKLGLYSADNVPKLELGMPKNRPLQTIGRQQINVCLHRQYMAEVKKQASATK